MKLADRARDLRGSVTSWNRRRVRRRLGDRFLKGAGIEIGALHQPMPLPPEATVRYLDRLSTADLRLEYPELEHLPIVEVDIVEDGENPVSIDEESLDFVIASHVIEHCEDPIGTLKNWTRILRPGGVIFLVVPDRRRTFDRGRKPTSVDHLLEDHRRGPGGSRLGHYREWVRLTDHDRTDAEVDRKAKELMDQGYRPHFHVWSADEFRDSFATIFRTEGMDLEIAGFGRNFREFVVVLKKS